MVNTDKSVKEHGDNRQTFTIPTHGITSSTGDRLDTLIHPVIHWRKDICHSVIRGRHVFISVLVVDGIDPFLSLAQLGSLTDEGASTPLPLGVFSHQFHAPLDG
jgi:hypothetical protein